MKRTRVDGQLSRLEYEEQEAAAPSFPPGGGFDSYVSFPRPLLIVSDDVSVGYTSGWPLTIAHPHTRRRRPPNPRAPAGPAVAAWAGVTAARRSSRRRPRRWRRGGW